MTPSPGRLGNWTANLFFIRRQAFVLAVSNVTLLPVVLPLAPAKTLLSRFPAATGEVLQRLGIPPHLIASELEAMGECVAARASDHRILGSITDLGWSLEAYLDGRPLVDVAVHLADTPCGPLGMKQPVAVTPLDWGASRIDVVELRARLEPHRARDGCGRRRANPFRRLRQCERRPTLPVSAPHGGIATVTITSHPATSVAPLPVHVPVH
jgi:hypothetical protein